MEPTVTRPQVSRPEAETEREPRVVSTPGTCGGKPRIAGHRITVQHLVIDHLRGGLSPDEIVSAYPSLSLSDVYAALAYYHDHRDEVDADIREAVENWDEIERTHPGRLVDRLGQRKVDAANDPLPPG